MSSSDFNETRCDPTAQAFLQRIDKLKDTSKKHPIFLVDHPEDEPGDDTPAVDRFCFTNTPRPIITTDSHRYNIRQLAQKNQQLLNDLPYQLHAFSLPFLKSLIPGVFRLLLQLLRPWLTLFALYQFLQTSSTIYLILFLLLLKTLSTDETFLHIFNLHTSKVRAGTYYNTEDPLMASLAKNNDFFNGVNTYQRFRTPWLYNGDLRTVFPYAFSSGGGPRPWIQRWVHHEDGEAIRFDISFPEDANTKELYHDNTKTIHIILHGLNGDSSESYILSYAQELNKLGHTVISLISRGFGGTPIVKYQIFNATRTTDLENLVRVAHVGAGNSLFDDFNEAPKGTYTTKSCFKYDVMDREQALAHGFWNNTIVAGGYSLGGIITTNYCITHKGKTGLLAAIGMSTSGDCRENLKNKNSEQNWQAFLTYAAKVNIIVPQQYWLSPNSPAKLPVSLEDIANIQFVPDFDAYFTCRLLGYQSVSDYYEELSFCINDRLENLDTPILVMNSDDDPVISVDTLYGLVQDVHVKKQYKNVIVLITNGGGHAAFPVGASPHKTNWWYSATVSHQFCDHVLKSHYLVGQQQLVE